MILILQIWLERCLMWMISRLVLQIKGINVYRKCKIRFSEGGFNLRKFRTNDIDVKRVFDCNEVKFNAEEHGKVMGISWDEVGDLVIIRYEDF